MSEPNELQNAGSLGNTSEVPAVTPAAAPATPAPQAVPSAQPAATAQPTQPAQANQPAQPAAAPAAQPAPSVHATLFDKILTTMGGGPTTIQRRNPLTGETTTETQQSSRATLAKTILAGALTGLFAGAGAPRDAYGRPSMAAGAKQGFQAGQQMIQQRDDKAQSNADADTKNKQLAFANHFELIKNMAASTAAKHASLAQMNSDSAPFIKDAHDLDAISDPKTPRAVIAENLDKDAATKMVQGHHGEYSVMNQGFVSVLNPETGESEEHPTYAVLRSGSTIPLSGDTLKVFALSQPAYSEAADKVPDGVRVTVAQANSALQDQSAVHNAQGVLDDLAQLTTDFPGAKQVDLMALLANDRSLLPAIRATRDQLGTFKPTWTQLDALRAAPNGVKILSALGITPDEADKFINKKVDERTAQAKLAAAGADPRKNPADPALVASFRTDIKASYPGLNTGQVDALARQLTPHPTEQLYKETQDTAAKLDAANTARAQKGTEISDKDQQTMWKTGIAPTSHEHLSLDNAPDEFMVDTRTGNPIPSSMLSTMKPTMQESNRADFAKSAIHSLGELNELISSNEAKFGPITGPVDKWMASHGLSDEYQQKALNYLTFAQSAATGAHVGGRFNVPIMDKMGTTVSVNMDKDQLKGATDSINDVMQQYVDQGGRFSVAQYRALPQKEKDRLQGKAAPPQQAQYQRGANGQVQKSTDGGASWQ